MIRLLIRAAVFLGSAAIGLLATSLLVDGVRVQAGGFIAVVVIYALVQSILAPFVTKVAAKNASVLLGGTGLVAAFLALLVATTMGRALTISGGVGTWIAATVVVWVVTALATLMLPWLLLKAGVQAARQRRSDA